MHEICFGVNESNKESGIGNPPARRVRFLDDGHAPKSCFGYRLRRARLSVLAVLLCTMCSSSHFVLVGSCDDMGVDSRVLCLGVPVLAK